MKKSEIYYFIVNPASRSGRGRKLWHALKPRLKAHHIRYRVFFTTGPDTAGKSARHLALSSRETIRIIVMGGDGTLNEVAGGIHHLDNMLLGYIPTGSSNDFARAHKTTYGDGKISFSHLHREASAMDTGLMTAGKNTPRAFIVSTGIGYDAAVTSECNTSSLKKFLNKLYLGKLAYLLIGIKHIFTRKTEDMTVTTDTNKAVTFKNVFFISVHNHRCEGGGFTFAPDAVPNDGLLDVCIIYGLNKLQLIPVLLASIKGRHTHFKGVQTMRCRHIDIKSKSPQPVHADGEACGMHTSLEVSCCPHSLKMLL